MAIRRLACILVFCLLVPISVAYAGVTERVSVSSSGEQANRESGGASCSWDGRFVVFGSWASNLVPGDTNDRSDIFVRDRQNGTTERVSVTSEGEEGTEYTMPGRNSHSISADGRFVVFFAAGGSLAPEDPGGTNVFVRDRLLGTTELVTGATEADDTSDWSIGSCSISADGRFIGFAVEHTLDPELQTDAYLYDRQEGTTRHVAEWAGTPVLSADGRFLAFSSSHLNPGCTPHVVMLYDRQHDTTEVVSVNTLGEPAEGNCGGPSISADGRFVAFVSDAQNLVPDKRNGGTYDIFVRDRRFGTTERVSVSSGGVEADNGSSVPCISANGRFVAFTSYASNLVPGDTNETADIFVFDRYTDTIERVNVSSAGEEAQGWSWGPFLSKHGRYVGFSSYAPNLVPDDTNEQHDTFLVDRGPQTSFGDVSCDHWASSEIEACVTQDVVAGYGDGMYLPEAAVTRDQMAVYLARGLAGGDDTVPVGPGTPSFWDVGAEHWAYRYVEYTAGAGVVEGYREGDYRPDLPVDRAQMAVYVARSIATPVGEAGLADYEPPDTPTFSDVAEDFWAYTHVEYCAEHGVVQGYGDGLYHPDDTVTRDQMAVYIARAFGLML